MLRFDCPACGKRLKVPPDATGRAVRCPRCRSSITTPGVRPETPPEPETPDPIDAAPESEPPATPPAVTEPDDEPENPDYRPRRRRKGWRVSPIGAALVGGLVVVLLVALGGVASKLSAPGPTKAPPTNERVGARTPPRDDGSLAPLPRADAERDDERGGGFPTAVAIGAVIAVLGAALLVWRTRRGTPRRARRADDESDGDDRPRRRRRSGLPGGPAVAGGVLTVACLLGASFCWNAARAVERDTRASGYEPRQAKEDALRYMRVGYVTLMGSVGAWVFALLSLSAQLRHAPPAALWAVRGALLGGVLAVPVSQYMPLFGDWITTLSAPWSPERLSGIGLHWIGLALAGAVCCGALAALVPREGDEESI